MAHASLQPPRTQAYILRTTYIHTPIAHTPPTSHTVVANRSLYSSISPTDRPARLVHLDCPVRLDLIWLLVVHRLGRRFHIPQHFQTFRLRGMVRRACTFSSESASVGMMMVGLGRLCRCVCRYCSWFTIGSWSIECVCDCVCTMFKVDDSSTLVEPPPFSTFAWLS